MLARSDAMLPASVSRAPTAWPSRSNVASRPLRGRRHNKPMRRPKIPTATVQMSPRIVRRALPASRLSVPDSTPRTTWRRPRPRARSRRLR
ncbi:hypothetical protein VTK73DRAFT_2418 [Phialemonium thermophilum]|uniref:Uncharacterized protein n=1 Tax=Phialemonium thermophilum TaxID=223376 RepID=A0ABR3VS59_9PEZI